MNNYNIGMKQKMTAVCLAIIVSQVLFSSSSFAFKMVHKSCPVMKSEVLKTGNKFRAIATTGGVPVTANHLSCGVSGRATRQEAQMFAMKYCIVTAKKNHDPRPCKIIYLTQHP